MNQWAWVVVAVLTGCVGVAEDLPGDAQERTEAPEPTADVTPPSVSVAGVPVSSSKQLARITLAGVAATVVPGGYAVKLPWGTSLSSLAAVVEHTGISVSPASGSPQDFRSPVTYTVTAQDGSQSRWRVEASTEIDGIDLSRVTVFNSPADVASWPVTTKITRITMTPAGASRDDGLAFAFPARATWPDYTIPGWEGPLQYTVWAVVKVNGQWYASGYIQMWRQRVSTGAPLLTDFARNWAYDGRWGPMMGHNPIVGEEMGFFVTAGNARGEGGVTSVRERSQVVRIALPAGDVGTFEF